MQKNCQFDYVRFLCKCYNLTRQSKKQTKITINICFPIKILSSFSGNYFDFRQYNVNKFMNAVLTIEKNVFLLTFLATFQKKILVFQFK